MTTTEEHLGRFYIELQAWIDGGCEKHPCFKTSRGICVNAYRWQEQEMSPTRSEWLLWDALHRQFVDADLDPAYPFAGIGQKAAPLYTNPARLAWIKEHAEAAKAALKEA